MKKIQSIVLENFKYPEILNLLFLLMTSYFLISKQLVLAIQKVTSSLLVTLYMMEQTLY